MSDVRTLFDIDINGKRYRIFPVNDRIVIGSGPKSDIIISAEQVSDKHLKIKYDHVKSKIKFMDLNSSYGMVANGAHLQTRSYYEYQENLAIYISPNVKINEIKVSFIVTDLDQVDELKNGADESKEVIEEAVELEEIVDNPENVLDFQKLLDITGESFSSSSQTETIKLKAKEEALNIQKTYMRLGQKIVEDANAEAELIYQKAKLKSEMILENIKIKKEDVVRRIQKEHDQLLRKNEEERTKLQDQVDLLRKEKTATQDQNEKIIEEQAQLNQQLFKINEEISAARKELSALNAQKNEIQQNIYNLNREKEIFFDHFDKEKAQRIENLESKVGNLHAQINKINQEKNNLEEEEENLKEQIKQLDVQSRALSDLVQSRELRLADEEQKFTQYMAYQQEKIEEYQNNLHKLEDQIKNLNDDLKAKLPVKANFEEEILSLEKEHHVLIDLISRTNEEYEDLRKKLLKDHEKLKDDLAEELKHQKNLASQELNQFTEDASKQKRQLMEQAQQQAESVIANAQRQGQDQLEKIEQKAEDLLQLARDKANSILAQAQTVGNQKVEELIKNAHLEKDKIIEKSKQQMMQLEAEAKKDADSLVQLAKSQSYQLQQDGQTIYLKKMDDLSKEMQEFREKKIRETNELITQKQQELSPKYQKLVEQIEESNKLLKEKEKYASALDKQLSDKQKELEAITEKCQGHEAKVMEELEEFRTNFLKESKQQLLNMQAQVKALQEKYQADKLSLDNLINNSRNKEKELRKKFEDEINHHREMAVQEIAQLKIKADREAEMLLKAAKEKNDHVRKLIVKEVSDGVGTVLTVELKSKLNGSGIQLDYQKIVKEVRNIVEFSVLENDDALHNSQFKSLLKLEKKSPWKNKKFLTRLLGVGVPAVTTLIMLIFFPATIKKWFNFSDGNKSAQEKFVEKIKEQRDARPRFSPKMQANIMATYTQSILHTKDFSQIYLSAEYQKKWAQRVDELFVNRFNKTEEATVRFITVEGRMIRNLQNLRDGIIYDSQKNETQKLDAAELSFLQDIAKIVDSKNLPELNKARTEFYNKWPK